ncbi:MAG: polysaccharide biosynthesis tyrosine autokinase [Ignavibacteria bacterium]|nr:polysaccharide biosynthesis tyrosine autokinase [Ignavibacteria bacterium]
MSNNGNPNIDMSQQPMKKITVAHPSDNIKDYINIIRSNLFLVIVIFLAAVLSTLIYVMSARDIYKAVTTVKINKPQGSILSGTILPEFQDFQNDRYISNEIEILKSYKIREVVANALIDTFKKNPSKSDYFYIVNRNPDVPDEIVGVKSLSGTLGGIISINQKRGLDIIEISAESPSRYESKLIADTFAEAYLSYSLAYSRREVTAIRKFLDEEKTKRANDLAKSEVEIQDYMQKGGVIYLDDKAKNLVDQLTTFEAEKNASEVELNTRQRAYDEIKNELAKVDASLPNYIEGRINEPYFNELQKKVAELEIQRELDASIPKEEVYKKKIYDDYEKKLEPLKSSLDDKTKTFKTGIYASTPEEQKNLSGRLLDLGVEIQSTRVKMRSLSKMIGKYENEFSKLPTQSIELARLQRTKQGTEKLYLTLEEKYQEAIINERSQLGNVNIVDEAMMPSSPSKPNRQLIIIAGCGLGLALGIGFAFLRNYLDRSIKTPEELENKGVPVLAWIPSVEELSDLGSSQVEFIVANKPNASASESFKALRTRVSFSKLEQEQLKTILVTSSIPAEGKTTVALNLAGSFSQADKRVLLLDADLRKPRIHSIFEAQRFPGLSDHLFGNVSLEDITRETKLENLSFVTSGTIPPNPSEMLGSKQMKEFLEELKSKYDYIIIDSPPFISVTDSEILSRLCDGTIVVIQASKTPMDAFSRTFDRIMAKDSNKFLGAVLNNFNFKSIYGYYYNYYYYYSRPESSKIKDLKVKGKVKTSDK